MKQLFKKLLKLISILVVLSLIVLILVTTLVDIDQYKNEITQFIKDETGLDVEVNGELYFSLLSGIKFKADDIAFLSNKKVLAHIDSIVLGTTLSSLYQDKAEFTSLEIIVKKLHLIRDKKGQYNFLPALNKESNKNAENNTASSIDKFFLQQLSIKNIHLSIGHFQFQDKSSSLTLELESLNASLSFLPIIDHYEWVIDDPRILVDYSYSGTLTAKKVLVNQYQVSALSFSFNDQKGNIAVRELAFQVTQKETGKSTKKLDFNAKGKLSLSIDYRIEKDSSEPVWGQPELIKINQFDLNLPNFQWSEKDYQLEIKESHLSLEDVAVFEENKLTITNMVFKSLAFNSDQIDFSHNSKNKYHFNNSALKIKNLPVLHNAALFDPLSNDFLSRFSQQAVLDLSIDSLVKNELGINNIKLAVQGKDKTIKLSNLSFNAIDSEINAAGVLSLKKKIPFWELEVHSDKLNLKPLASLINYPAEAEGYIAIDNKLSGTLKDSDFKINAGRVHAKASDIMINGIDLDKILTDFESSQSVGLLDVGAIALLGPAGMALSKGNDYTKLLKSLGGGGKSIIKKLNSDISYSNDIASMDDVSFITAKHQLAIKGKINLRDETLMDFQVATIDKDACPIYKEQVKGSLQSPAIKKVNVFVDGVVNPIKSVTSKLSQTIKLKCKEPFYNGVLKYD